MTREEQITGYVFGSLSPLERAAVAQARLADLDLDAAITALEESLAPLTGIAGKIRPPDHLFDRVAAAIADQTDDPAGMSVQAIQEGEWLPYSPGIDFKFLWSPEAFLLRCQPGAVLAAHHHPENEHLLVISGDLVIGGRPFRTGDYHVAPADSVHGEAHTDSGCLLLVQHVTQT